MDGALKMSKKLPHHNVGVTWGILARKFKSQNPSKLEISTNLLMEIRQNYGIFWAGIQKFKSLA
jgi:hypothetical protein